MIPSTELQVILEGYHTLFPESSKPRFDAQHLARFISSKSYAHLRSQRPNLGTLLIAACRVIEDAGGGVGICMDHDGQGEVRIMRASTEERAVAHTLTEALVHFADELLQ